MLGWEFPPLINGGLGIACYGIAKSLSQLAEVSLIIPRADPEFVMNNVELIGLNNSKAEELLKGKSLLDFKDFLDIEYVESNLLPYQKVKKESLQASAPPDRLRGWWTANARRLKELTFWPLPLRAHRRCG